VRWYDLKRTLLAPRTAWRRRRAGDLDEFTRSALELHYYRTPMLDFIAAMARDPDLLHAAQLGEGALVLDVGAYDGEWAERMLARHPCRVEAFEPDPTSFPRLLRRLEHESRFRATPVALGCRDTTATMALDLMGSSLFASRGVFGSAPVAVRDVAAVLDGLRVERVDLMKVNIEGGEYDVFERLIDAGWISRIDQILVQFHEWHPHAQARRRRIRRALSRTHVEAWNYPFVWEFWTRSASTR
jgi:FkbM family methyltransferase